MAVNVLFPDVDRSWVNEVSKLYMCEGPSEDVCVYAGKCVCLALVCVCACVWVHTTLDGYADTFTLDKQDIRVLRRVHSSIFCLLFGLLSELMLISENSMNTSTIRCLLYNSRA